MPDLPEYSETNEFFARELGLEGKKINHEENFPLPPNSLIYANDLTHWHKRLRLSEKASVTVVIGSNEYYDPRKLLLVNALESIKCVFLQYLPNGKRVNPTSLIKFVRRFPNILLQRAFYGTLKLAINGYQEFDKDKFEVPVYEFPLGYTERFANELKILGIMPEGRESLYLGNDITDLSNRHTISFFGQKGSWFRRLIVDYFQSLPKFKMEEYSSFGGFTDLPSTTRYSELILESCFVICPPGNCSSQSFRYYETIALGAIPVLSETSLQDWNSFDYWPEQLPWKRDNFLDVWLHLSKLPQRELNALSSDLREHVRTQISTTKNLLTACVGDGFTQGVEEQV